MSKLSVYDVYVVSGGRRTVDEIFTTKAEAEAYAEEMGRGEVMHLESYFYALIDNARYEGESIAECGYADP